MGLRGSGNTNSIAWGDYNNDGCLDQLAGNDTQPKRVYKNNGDGTFTPIWASAETGNTYSVAWGDFDNDGCLDMLMGNANQGIRVYKNNGGDAFSSVWTAGEPEAQSVAWGDYDNDGYLDQLIGNSNSQATAYIEITATVHLPPHGHLRKRTTHIR